MGSELLRKLHGYLEHKPGGSEFLITADRGRSEGKKITSIMFLLSILATVETSCLQEVTMRFMGNVVLIFRNAN